MTHYIKSVACVCSSGEELLHDEDGALERGGAEPESEALRGQSRSQSIDEDLEEDRK